MVTYTPGVVACVTSALRLKQLPPSRTRAIAKPPGTGRPNGVLLQLPASVTRLGLWPSRLETRVSAIVSAANA
ncbi:hypothetical protein [Sphingomonas sp. LR59]|uniref:hypothetical protein n=1 Tax=Sphingomonas sp. LR59 TaxID=3050232 RepID=UPI002FE40BA5